MDVSPALTDPGGFTQTPFVLAYMPHRTLQEDGTTEEGFAEREVIDALHGPTGNKEPLLVEGNLTPWESVRCRVHTGEEHPTLMGGKTGDRGNNQPNVLISSAEASPAKTSPSPAAEQDSKPVPDPPSSSSSHESLTLCCQTRRVDPP